jgi:nucleotide-binding universal stress UspA family protein
MQRKTKAKGGGLKLCHLRPNLTQALEMARLLLIFEEEGNIWPELAKLIKEHEIDLVITATHGRGNLQKVLIGSVAEEIFRQADCAVLTVGPRVKDEPAPEAEPKNILFATDFGAGAEKAAAHAFWLAQEHGARVTMLHVIQEVTAFTEESVRTQREFNVEKLQRLVPEGAENWCKPVFRATFGAAAEEILTMARETNADLIVLGAKARKSLAGHAPFTIAYNVVTKPRCPVLTVRG